MQALDNMSLMQEANNARQLAEAGLKLLESMKDTHYDSAGMLACLGLAAEKLTKIAYGLGIYNETGQWPESKIRDFSHKLDEIEPVARGFVAKRQASNPNRALSLWIAQIENSEWLPKLFSTLRNYGSGGRFYYLDAIVGAPKYPAPEDQWNELEDEVLEIPLDLPIAQLEPALQECRRQIATTYRDWWTMYESAMIHGAFGRPGVQLSASVALSSDGGRSLSYLSVRGRVLTRV